MKKLYDLFYISYLIYKFYKISQKNIFLNNLVLNENRKYYLLIHKYKFISIFSNLIIKNNFVLLDAILGDRQRDK